METVNNIEEQDNSFELVNGKNNFFNQFWIEDLENCVKSLKKEIHEPIRFGILYILYQNSRTTFSTLKNYLKASSGNLSRHLTVLFENGLIEKRKQRIDERIVTTYKISTLGKNNFLRYIENFVSISQSLLD